MTGRSGGSGSSERPRLLVLNLFVIHPPDTGAKLVIWNRIVELSRDFEVTFCCLDEGPVPGHSLAALGEHARVVRVRPAAPRGPASRILDAARQPSVRLFAEPVRSWLAGPEAVALHAERFDLVEVHSSCWHRDELDAISGLRVLVAHNDEVEYWRAQAESSSGGARARLGARLDAVQAGRQQRAACAAADAIVALSPRDADRLRPLVGTKPLLVNPGGIDCARYDDVAAHAEGDPDELVYVAAFFVEAAAESARRFVHEVLPPLRARRPSLRLRLVGDHRDHPTMLRLREADGVEVTGRVDDVRPALRRAGVVVVPVSRGSGIRLKVMEACAAGQPLVTTRKGAEGLGLIDGDHAVIADDVGGMAGAIERVLGDAGLRRQLRAGARALALERFDRRRRCAELGAWYRALLGGGAGAQLEA